MATVAEPVQQQNPLTLGTPKALLPQPCALVIFGAAGDLSWRKLLPAVYNLNVDGVLPSNFAVVGFGLGEEGDPDQWPGAHLREAAARGEQAQNEVHRCLDQGRNSTRHPRERMLRRFQTGRGNAYLSQPRYPQLKLKRGTAVSELVEPSEN